MKHLDRVHSDFAKTLVDFNSVVDCTAFHFSDLFITFLGLRYSPVYNRAIDETDNHSEPQDDRKQGVENGANWIAVVAGSFRGTTKI